MACRRRRQDNHSGEPTQPAQESMSADTPLHTTSREPRWEDAECVTGHAASIGIGCSRGASLDISTSPLGVARQRVRTCPARKAGCWRTWSLRHMSRSAVPECAGPSRARRASSPRGEPAPTIGRCDEWFRQAEPRASTRSTGSERRGGFAGVGVDVLAPEWETLSYTCQVSTNDA